MPKAPALSRKEEKQVSYFLLFREQCQDSPLYTQARTWIRTAGAGRPYGQEQLNRRYGQATKATVDAFTAVATHAHKFQKRPRALPDLGSRPFAKEFFPPELHATLDGDDEPAGPAGKRRRVGPKTLGLSSITSYRTAEEVFLPEAAQREQPADGAGGNLDKALQLLSTVEKRVEEGGDDDGGILSGEDEDEWFRGNGDDDDEDGNAEDEDQYEDDSADDYNAEAYFEGNQDDDDYDEGGDDGADFF